MPLTAFLLQNEIVLVVAVWVGLFVLVPLGARLVVGLRRRRAGRGAPSDRVNTPVRRPLDDEGR